MLNQLVRYAPILSLLRRERGTILEVGCGADGVSAYLQRAVIGLEIRFSGPPGAFLIPVRGTASRLPFADASADVVLLVDVLEHVPAASRAQCLDEAMRVARRRIIVGGPIGAPAREADERLASFYRRRGIPTPDWLAEHLAERAPDLEQVTAPLRDAGWAVRWRGNENRPLHLALMRMETRSFWYRALGRARRHLPGTVAAVARSLRLPPYYSYLVDATAPSHDSETRATTGPQS
jgi:SAM-dependent methyltransferase